MHMAIMIIIIIIFSNASAFAGTPATNNNASYDWINTVIFIIGLISLGWYQRRQIGILKKEVESQNNIISNLKQYSDIIDIKKVEEFVKISEATIEKKKEIELIDLHSNFKEKIKSTEDEKEKLLDKINKSTSEIDSLKTDYKSLVNASTQRAVFCSNLLTITTIFNYLSIVQTNALLQLQGLLLCNNIDDSVLANSISCFDELQSKLSKARLSIDVDDIFQFDRNIKASDQISQIDSECRPLAEKIEEQMKVMRSNFEPIVDKELKRIKNKEKT